MTFNGASYSSGGYNILTDNNYYDTSFQPLYDDNSIQYNGYVINV